MPAVARMLHGTRKGVRPMAIPIKRETLQFLKNLKAHNTREWFNRNKGAYNSAREDFLLFVQSLLDEVSKFDESVAGLEARSTLFRIYRDIRFSRDKTPYKTHFAASLTGRGEQSKLSGYYLHVQPEASFLAGGVYMAEPRQLAAIRARISNRGKEFLHIINNRNFKEKLTLEGKKLVRIPQGFNKEDPMGNYLRYKELVILHSMSDKEVLSDNFAKTCAAVFKAMVPFNGFMNDAARGLLTPHGPDAKRVLAVRDEAWPLRSP